MCVRRCVSPVQPVFSVNCLERLCFTFVLFNLFFTFSASSSVNSSLLLVRLQLKCCRLLFPWLRFVISHMCHQFSTQRGKWARNSDVSRLPDVWRVNSHLLVFLSRFFLSTSVQLKCQPVSTARYLLFPTHKLDSSLRSGSIWRERKKCASAAASISLVPRKTRMITSGTHYCHISVRGEQGDRVTGWRSASPMGERSHLPLNEPEDLRGRHIHKNVRVKSQRRSVLFWNCFLHGPSLLVTPAIFACCAADWMAELHLKWWRLSNYDSSTKACDWTSSQSIMKCKVKRGDQQG